MKALPILALALAAMAACSRETPRAGPDPVTKPTPAPPPAPSPPPTTQEPGACAVDLDCRLTSLGEDCCDHCGQVALTVTELADRERTCAAIAKKCPALDCPFEPSLARCEGGRCVRVKRP